ncbi:MAG TPA: hypothetical protein ENG95_06760 [Nitrospirae bacterium]|nr:hypothetical protein [Nitrospirota bacterium]
MTGCATTKAEKKVIKKAEAPTIRDEVIVPPSGSYEECLELLPVHIMEYSFTASKPLTFNIHYHTEEDIIYPVLKEEVSEWSGILSVADQDYYDSDQEFFCLMWGNPHTESVKIIFEYKVREE